MYGPLTIIGQVVYFHFLIDILAFGPGNAKLHGMGNAG
jgi:hypothetical protein